MHKLVLVYLLALGYLGQANCAETEKLPQEPGFKNDTTFLQKVYRRTYKVMRRSRAFRNYTYQDAIKFVDDAEAFQAPESLETRFPYYLAGYDFDDRPVWVSEAGKYRVDDLIERVVELYPVFEKMGFQAFVNVIKSIVARERPGKKIRQIVVMVDCAGFDMSVAMNNFYKFFEYSEWPRLMEMGITLGDLYMDLGVSAIGQVILINANYAAKLGIEVARPIVGQLIERLVVLGTNPYKWKAELRRLLPPETIPTWYGGSKDFRPLAVYG